MLDVGHAVAENLEYYISYINCWPRDRLRQALAGSYLGQASLETRPYVIVDLGRNTLDSTTASKTAMAALNSGPADIQSWG